MIQQRLSSVTEDCASTMNRDCGGHRETEDQSVEDVTERTSMPQTVCRNSLSYQGETGPVAQTADQSVKWADFLVDSGSACLAVSNSFYKHLREGGAPVGEIRPTNRRLRGANGSQIAILGCSFCVVAFLICVVAFLICGSGV